MKIKLFFFIDIFNLIINLINKLKKNNNNYFFIKKL